MKQKNWKPERVVQRVAAMAILGTLSACGSSLSMVESGHLNPVVRQYQVTAGIHLDNEFRNAEQTVERDGLDWTAMLGEAQRSLFDRIVDASFESSVTVENLDEISSYDVDFVIYPKIIEYVYLSPEDSGSDFYAVSIKYSFKILDTQGAEITEWVVNAYGKNRSSFLNGKQSLSEATNIALRDAAAAVILEFENNEKLIALLDPQAVQNTAPAIEAPAAEPAITGDTEESTT